MRGDLYLTDGTTRINLLTGIDGFYLQNWNPAIAGRKSTFRDSPLTDGRKPALMRWSNATETMSFHVGRFTQNDVIHDTQDLRRLLLAAEEYFLGGSDIPVWLEARGNCETNTRYAVVVTWGTSNDSDPYRKPFDLDHPTMSPWTLTLERQHWRHLPPGQTECVELSATQDYYDEQDSHFMPAESADDCEVLFGAGGIVLNGAGTGFGKDGVGESYGTGIRFAAAIPQGADISYAYVVFQSRTNVAVNDCNVLIEGEDIDDAALFTTFANYTGRTRTTANATWNAIGAWVAGTQYTSPSLVTIVQEIVDRPGWASGNHLVLFFDDNGSTNGARRQPEAWDGGVYETTLYVGWFDGTTRTFGRTATCNNEVYVANKHNIAQLTHVWYDDGGVFSVNLIGSGLPFAFLPAVPAVNDAVYFGISTAAINSGPFCSLVFDILAAQAQVNTITWEYWDSVAGAWHALDVRDNTNNNGAMTGLAFNTTGVNSVHWTQPAGAVHNWGTTVVNGVTGYWVRALVGGVGGAPTAPTQQNRDIYTIVTPYVDTTSANVIGDIQALAELFTEGQSGQTAPNPVIKGQTVLYAGLRSYDRGANFTSFLNLADEQNQTGITVTVNGGTATFVTDVFMPTGRCVDWTTGGAAAEAMLTYVTIPTALVDDFTGRFRCFLRMQTISGVASDLLFRLKIGSASNTNVVYQTTQKRSLNNSSPFLEIIDFGTISIPFRQNDTGDTHWSFVLRIDGQALAAVHAHLVDIWIIPSDECFIEGRSIPPIGSSTPDVMADLLYSSAAPKRLDIDSTIPRRMVKIDITNTSGTIFSGWSSKINSPLIWQPNERQRWWFAQQNDIPANNYADIVNSLSIQGWEVSRYLSMRGAR